MTSKIPFSLFLFVIFLSTCVIEKEGGETIEPKQFKTQIPFDVYNGKLFITTYWGKDNTKQLLVFDNHAPTLADGFHSEHQFSFQKTEQN